MLDPADAELQTAARCDVLVIGGGRGGATTAALLAERGRNAVRKGATAIEACRATGVEFHANGAAVTVRQEDSREQRWQTKFVVDASGRDTVLANQFGMQSAFAGTDTVETCLDNPHHASDALQAFDRTMRHGPKVFPGLSIQAPRRP